jgi:plastocyanin
MRAFVLVLLVAALGVASPAPSPDGGGKGQGAVAVVHIRMFAFVPSKVVVSAGQTVRFVNDDDEAHTVTASDKSFDSAGLDTGDSWSHVFSKTGTFNYFCALHPYMKGVVVVSAAGGAKL